MQYDVSNLIFAEYNPRELTKDQHQDLKDSITRFGFVDPLIVNTHKERKNILVGGHQRLKIAKELGYKDVPCVEVDLTPDKEKELNVRLNKNTGQWDWDALANHFDVGELLEWGFSEDELQFTEPEVQGLTDDDDVPEVEESITKQGDLWILGEHRLLCGDATKKEDVERLMDGQKADMVFTDPPYGISVVQGKKVDGDKSFGKVGGGKIVKAQTYSEIIGDDTTNTANDFYNNCISLGMKNFIIWGGNYFSNFLKASMCWLVWDKENTGNFADVELAWTSFNKSAKLYKWQWNGMIRKGDKNIEGKKRVHPTQKPVGLFTEIFKDFDFKNCFDGFLGSGSTLIACEKTNRKCYGMEIDPHYCDVIVKRWEDYTGNKAERFEAANA